VDYNNYMWINLIKQKIMHIMIKWLLPANLF